MGFASTNPQPFGLQTGLTQALLAQLGGGFSELAVRITLFDGDSAAGNFDFNNNTLLLNGINFGNWTGVQAQNTDGTGTVAGSFSGGGFRNNTLDTGFFYSNNAALLGSIFASIFASGELGYAVDDVDPFDNFYDFTQGVDGGLINIGQGPTIIGAPEGGSTLLLLGCASLVCAAVRRFAGSSSSRAP